MTGLYHDLIFGLRMLVKDKVFTTAALLTLALCIGANTAVFSVVNGVVLRPLPFEAPERLVVTNNMYPNVLQGAGQNSVADYFDRREKIPSFESVGIYRWRNFITGELGSPERIDGLEVTPSLLEVLGISPFMGRNFTEDEMTDGAARVVLVSHDFWVEFMGADLEAVGSDLWLNGESHTVAGVLPKGLDFNRKTRIWVCGQFDLEQRGADGLHTNSYMMLARLGPGASLESARRELEALNKGNYLRLPDRRDLLKEAGFYTEIESYTDDLLREVRMPLLLLQVGVLLLLVIGCVNVANLLLSRSTGRAQELAVRFALGAGVWRVARQLMIESLVVSISGGLLGLIVGLWGISAIELLGGDQLPRAEGIGVDLRVLGFTATVSVLTGLVSGLVPVTHLLGSNLRDFFQQTTRTGPLGLSVAFVRSALVVIQVALAFVLMVGAVLLMRSFLILTSIDPGFDYHKVETGRIVLSETGYPEPEDRVVFIERLLLKLRTLPGMDSVSVAGMMPFGAQQNASTLSADGYEITTGNLPPVANWFFVDGSYFSTMGIPFVDGRSFAPTDHLDAEPVVVIDRSLAAHFWPGEDPVGRTVYDDLDPEDSEAYRVVGMVDSVKISGLDETESRGDIYFSIRQVPQDDFYLTYRSSLEEGGMIESVRSALLDLDPEILLMDVKSLKKRVDDTLSGRRTPMILLQVFGGIALILSAVGIFGVLSYSVSQRRREIGIRIAIGARVRQIGLMVLRSGLKLVLSGLALGAVGAYALTRYVESLLFGVGAVDPVAFFGSAVLLAAVGVLACYLPALRASKVNPLTLLREE